MTVAPFHDELARWGPGGPGIADPREAAAYCRNLARGHYENFAVASWLLPRALRQHFYNVYAFCRWADDLGDEVGDPAQSLALLDWWESQLAACYDGNARHPVFVALVDTIQEFQIPREPFGRLIAAFRRDQTQSRYATWDELLTYAHDSANPVGELVLYLGRCHRPELVRFSDKICTGLQLANFWQDVARDYAIGRVYLPADVLGAAGVSPAMLAAREENAAFRAALRALVDRTEVMLQEGSPLIDQVSAPLRLDIALFVEGGRAILAAIRRQDFAVWTHRPVLSRADKFGLAARC